MNKLFADDPVQGNREFSFLAGYCVVLTSTVLVYIIPAVGIVMREDSIWWLAPSIVSATIGFWLGKETWRRWIAAVAIACLFIEVLRPRVWLLAFLATSAIDGWRVRKRRNQLFGLED